MHRSAQMVKRSPKELKFFFRLLKSAEKNLSRKNKTRSVHFRPSLLYKGNEAHVVALCLSDSLPLLQPVPFPACVPIQTDWDRMRVPERLFLPVH